MSVKRREAVHSHRPGERLRLEIVDLNHDGDGVGRAPDGFVLFVPEALPGDEVEVVIESVRARHGIGRLIAVERPAPDRIDPSCAVASECGGCTLQHFSYPAQLSWKEARVKAAMERVGGISDVPVRPILGMASPFAYRNKAQYPIGVDQTGKAVLGFYRRKSHEIVPHDECLIQHPTIVKVAKCAGRLIQELDIPVYREETGEGFARHLIVRVSFARGEAMAILVTKERPFEKAGMFAESLVRSVPEVKSVVQNINPKATNVVMGPENNLLWGAKAIVEEIGAWSFEISPNAFFQINPVQTEALYAQAAAYAALTGGEELWDVYCGAGTIGIYLSANARRVRGVERVRSAVEDARRNAARNGITHAEFEVGAAEDILPGWVREGARPDVCVLDPPRAGCDPKALASVAEARPTRIVYVSCNPSTLARDAAFLQERGYDLDEIRPVDMFPHTPHVEAVASLSRRGEA